jgi:hypothetical protein
MADKLPHKEPMGVGPEPAGITEEIATMTES